MPQCTAASACPLDPATRLIASGSLALEAVQPDFAIVYDTVSRRRLRLSRSLYDLLLAFDGRRGVGEVVPSELFERLAPQVTKLMQVGFLVDHANDTPTDAAEHLLTTVSPTLFRAPHARDTGYADVAVVGVPYDSGSVVRSGSRLAPRDLRARAADQEYRLDLRTGRPMGWYEVERDRRLLEGVTIADWGDVRVVHGEAPADLFDRVARVAARVIDTLALPLFIGGDHSISYPIVDVLQRVEPLHVVWLDAHTDFGPLMPRAAHNHKNVVRRILSLPGVTQVVNVGHRGYTASDKVNVRPPSFSVVPAALIRRQGPAALLARLPAGARCYVSIDIDVLDPVYAPGTGTPTPGGLTLDELKDTLRALGEHCDLVGVDLVEVNLLMDPGVLTEITARQIMTVALAAAMARRGSAAHRGATSHAEGAHT